MTAFEPINVPQAVKLKVADFLLLNDSGAFADYGKTELIDGEILCMNAQFSRHARIKTRLARLLGDALEAIKADLEVMIEVSVQLSDDSMPEPDLTLTSYRGNDPVPLASVALFVEVADSTFDHDMGRKASLYAKVGIPEYWVIDVEGDVIHQFWAPEGERFKSTRTVAFGDDVVAATIPELQVSTRPLY
jgi:Uma2 family endonuclease